MLHRLITLAALLLAASAHAADKPNPPDKPNILWLTTEDMGPHLGCYGDTYAVTPNVDAFAARSLRYKTCWSNAPVCAPARTTIITGVYPTSFGAEHMRSRVKLPEHIRPYPEVLRDAGYYCTNNAKEDYNFVQTRKIWDESSNKAHYKNRPAGKPFMAVFNYTGTHESQIRKRPHTLVSDPAKVRIPAYHPDTPEVRHDWAQYYDNIRGMDTWFAGKIKELEEAGLADSTIVFFYGDHGSGMPRSKRWCYNSGLHVPLIVHVPEKFKHLAPKDYKAGGMTDRLVSFVDLAPTLFSLVGVKPPEWVQGQAFMGTHDAAPRQYLFGFRGRMDERTDMVRSVTDGRYVYIRNFMPHRIYGQHLNYMFQTPTTRVWKQLYDEGKLNAAQKAFWEKKPVTELYELETDPDEVHNVATDARHHEAVVDLRNELIDWIQDTRDTGFIPEGEFHLPSSMESLFDVVRDKNRYSSSSVSVPYIATRDDDLGAGWLNHERSDGRYWAATHLLIRGKPAVDKHAEALRKLLNDPSPQVASVAAEALGQFGSDPDVKLALAALLKHADQRTSGLYGAMAALQAIDNLGPRADPIRADVLKLPREVPFTPGPLKEYINRLMEHIEK